MKSDVIPIDNDISDLTLPEGFIQLVDVISTIGHSTCLNLTSNFEDELRNAFPILADTEQHLLRK